MSAAWSPPEVVPRSLGALFARCSGLGGQSFQLFGSEDDLHGMPESLRVAHPYQSRKPPQVWKREAQQGGRFAFIHYSICSRVFHTLRPFRDFSFQVINQEAICLPGWSNGNSFRINEFKHAGNTIGAS